jgi:Ca2+/Na+ antiporter
MTSLLQTLEHILAPWQSVYSDSKVISTCVVGAHVLAMFIGGGFAIAADRHTLQAIRADAAERTRQLFELHEIHRPVLISMAVMLITGVMLAAADVKTFATAPMFWIKIALVVSLIVNGGVLTKAEESLRNGGMGPDVLNRKWERLRSVSWMSLVLWSATLIAGVILQNAT